MDSSGLDPSLTHTHGHGSRIDPNPRFWDKNEPGLGSRNIESSCFPIKIMKNTLEWHGMAINIYKHHRMVVIGPVKNHFFIAFSYISSSKMVERFTHLFVPRSAKKVGRAVHEVIVTWR